MPVKPNIPTPLQQHVVPIDSVTPWPGNPREGDIDAIAESLQAGGQWRLAVVQKSSGQICVGNNMWIAAKERLDWDGIAAIHLDLTDDQARRMLARDNRTSDRGSYNDYLLADFLNELSGTDLGLEGTGYTDEDLEDLLQTTSVLADGTNDFLTHFMAPDETPTPASAPPAPSAQPFSNAPNTPQETPQVPAQATGAHDADGAPPVTTLAPHNPVHTGPAVYTGPGAPAPSGAAQLPDTPALTNFQLVVTLDQRDILRAAIKHAQAADGHDNAPAALTAIAQRYLDTAAAGQPDDDSDDSDDAE